MQYDYNKEHFQQVTVGGIDCRFSNARIDRKTVPEGKFQYEIAGDDMSGGEPVRVQCGILVQFFGTLISEQPLPLGEKGVLWLDDGDFIWK